MIRLFTNFIILILTVFIGSVGFEFFVRYFIPQFDPSGHVNFKLNKDSVPLTAKRGEFRQIKNTGDYNVLLRISEDGFRESKPLAKSSQRDIFVVGDSFSFGWGVQEDERFSNQLAFLFGRSVFNISIPTDFDGYERLISYAQRKGAKISNLIIGVTMENDIQDYDKPAKDLTKNKLVSSNLLNLSKFKHFLRDHSAVYFLITSIIHRNQKLKKSGIQFGLITPNLAPLLNRSLNQRIIINSAKRLKRISKKFRSLILIIPSRALWTGSEEEKNIADKKHSLFISEISKLKINFLDMRKTLEKSGNPMTFHFKHDGHWTAAAHSLAARQLVGKLDSMATKW